MEPFPRGSDDILSIFWVYAVWLVWSFKFYKENKLFFSMNYERKKESKKGKGRGEESEEGRPEEEENGSQQIPENDQSSEG